MAEFKSDWKALKDKAGPFPPQAYQFVREGLARANAWAQMLGGENNRTSPPRSRLFPTIHIGRTLRPPLQGLRVCPV